jgi:urease accessory protein
VSMRHKHVTTAVVPVLAGAAAVVLSASPAGAHVGGHVSGLADGALHPLTGVDHLLAMVAVGLLAVLTGRVVAFPATFLLGMAVGGAAGIAGVALPGVEIAIVTSVVVLGVAIAFAPRASATWLLALVAVAGLVHGNAHGAEAPTAANPLLYVLGFLAVTAALHAAGVLGGVALRRVPAARVCAGAGVAAVGVLLLG